MNTFTPVQQKAIQSWTEQRDSLLREIGNYSTELNLLKDSTKEKGLALADLHESIAEARGRISELSALEERTKGSLSVEIVELEVRKSRLQGEVILLEEKCNDEAGRYAALVEATTALESAHDIMKDQAAIVNRVAGEMIETSQLHTSEMKNIMEEIRTISTEVIEKSEKNIATADITLNKLTMHVVDSQRPIPVRRLLKNGRTISEEEIKP